MHVREGLPPGLRRGRRVGGDRRLGGPSASSRFHGLLTDPSLAVAFPIRLAREARRPQADIAGTKADSRENLRNSILTTVVVGILG